MFYDRVQAYYFVRAYQESPPYAVSLSYGPGNSYTLENPFPDMPTGSFPSRWSNLACDPNGTNCSGSGSNLSTMFLNPNVDVPLTYQYNVSIQYEFLRNWVLDVAYVSSRGTKLMNSYRNVNLAQLATPENPIQRPDRQHSRQRSGVCGCPISGIRRPACKEPISMAGPTTTAFRPRCVKRFPMD